MEKIVKICASCRRELPIESFCIHRREADGRDCYCKECKRKMDHEYGVKNKDKIKQKNHEFYLENKEKIVEKNEKYRKSHLKKYRGFCTKAKNKLKTEIFTYYCGGTPRCSCGVIDVDILSIDHINGDGAKHRREIGLSGKGGYNFYRWLKKNNFPEGFQVLCYNCNFRKRLTEMKPKNPTPLQETRARYAQLVKSQCLEHYGKTCDCGEKDQVLLTLDHVENDGADHRKETNTRGYNFYIMLRKNGFPNNPPLKVRCMNCNMKKRSEYEKRKSDQNDDNGSPTVSV